MTKRRLSCKERDRAERRRKRYAEVANQGLQLALKRVSNVTVVDDKYIRIGFFGQQLYVTYYDKQRKEDVVLANKHTFLMRNYEHD